MKKYRKMNKNEIGLWHKRSEERSHLLKMENWKGRKVGLSWEILHVKHEDSGAQSTFGIDCGSNLTSLLHGEIYHWLNKPMHASPLIYSSPTISMPFFHMSSISFLRLGWLQLLAENMFTHILPKFVLV